MGRTAGRQSARVTAAIHSLCCPEVRRQTCWREKAIPKSQRRPSSANKGRHCREGRSELLPKLALLDRAGTDPEELLTAQVAVFHPVAVALEEQAWGTSGFDRVLIMWRRNQIEAIMRFLREELTALAGPRQG